MKYGYFQTRLQPALSPVTPAELFGDYQRGRNVIRVWMRTAVHNKSVPITSWISSPDGGRDWAHRDPKMKDARSVERIVQDIVDHLGKYRPLASVDQILRRFLEEMRAVS